MERNKNLSNEQEKPTDSSKDKFAKPGVGSSSVRAGGGSTGSGTTEHISTTGSHTNSVSSAPQCAKDTAQTTVDQTRQVVIDAYDKTSEVLSNAYDKTSEVLSNTYDKTLTYGHQNPGTLTLISFGAGIGIGLLLASSLGGRSRTSRIAEPAVNALSQLALEFFSKEDSISKKAVKAAATAAATVAATEAVLHFARRNSQSIMQDSEPPNHNSPEISKRTLVRESQNINQVFSMLVAAGNVDSIVTEQICSDTKTISWRFEGAPTLEAFYERNLVDDGQINIDLDITRLEINDQDTSRIAIIGVYPSSALHSIPAQVSMVENKLLVILEDPFVFLDPDKIEPIFDIPSFQAEVTLFAIKV
jgi:hypothetical protein